MISARVRSFEEYAAHRKNNAHVYNKIQQIEARLEEEGKKQTVLPVLKKEVTIKSFLKNLIKKTDEKPDVIDERAFTVSGYSYPAKAEVDFYVDYLYSDNVHINWRERVICPITGLNNRLRAAVHFIDFELNVDDNSKIYIAEQLTPLYTYLKKKYKHVTGSEYLGPDVVSGTVNDRGILHQDATRLSFRDGEFDYYLTFECFEHIPDYIKAFRESYRILKKGGMMFWTVPFTSTSHENVIRAKVEPDGSINHIMQPEYHGDPVNASEGILCYQYFGWEMFSQLKTIGFSDAYAITYWSDSLGYFNGEQFIFCAIK